MVDNLKSCTSVSGLSLDFEKDSTTICGQQLQIERTTKPNSPNKFTF